MKVRLVRPQCFVLTMLAFTSKLVSFGSMLSLVSTTGVVEVYLLGDSTIIFSSCNSVRVLEEVNKFFF